MYRILLAALLLTVLNAAKPVVVDDSAYLFFARHLSQQPLDPYGFTLFWYNQPDPAMAVLLPPVLPYWLGLGIAIFGENLILLKLWLFPFAALLALSVRRLLQRFAPSQAESTTVLILGSGFVVPLFNFMLDLPALSLGLAALVCYFQAIDTRQYHWSLTSAALLALALQTKYSMLTMPVVIVGATLVYGGWRHLAVVALCSALLFFGWETWLWTQYGTSHFFLHLNSESPQESWYLRKYWLLSPLIYYSGFLAGGWGLYASRAVKFPRPLISLFLLWGLVGTFLVVLTPGERAVLLTSSTGTVRLDLHRLFFGVLGIGLFFTLMITIVRLLIRWPSCRWRHNPQSLFLVGWLLLELLAYFLLSPFPAGRRVMDLSLVMALLAARLVSLRQVRTGVQPGWWVKGYILATGLGLFALDAWDAQAERDLAHQAASLITPQPGQRIWTQGHWGWQYYTDLHSMTLVNPGHSQLRAGDYLVLPREPDPIGFYRPTNQGGFQIQTINLELIHELSWEDSIAGQTIPNLYGGFSPIVGRNHPRLRVEIYRVIQDWVPHR